MARDHRDGKKGRPQIISGVEGLHSWTPPGGTSPAVVLGLLRNLTTGVEIWPRYRITRITGLHSLGDPQDVRDNLVGRVGEITRLSKRRGKSVVYEGRVEARSLRELREAETDLRAAFAVLDTEGRMSAAWHPDNTDFDDLGPRFFDARALACEIVDTQETQRWFRSFVVSLRMGDPRYFVEEVGTSASISSTNVEYGLDYP